MKRSQIYQSTKCSDLYTSTTEEMRASPSTIAILGYQNAEMDGHAHGNDNRWCTFLSVPDTLNFKRSLIRWTSLLLDKL